MNSIHLHSSGTPGSAGYDISSLRSCVIEAHSTKTISTGLMLGFPPNTYGVLVGRSSLAARGVDVTGGLLDNDYCGRRYFTFPHKNNLC